MPVFIRPRASPCTGNGVVGLVADRIGLVVADHEIRLGAQQFQQQRRQSGVAMIERADMPGPRDAGINRRETMQRHQHRRHRHRAGARRSPRRCGDDRDRRSPRAAPPPPRARWPSLPGIDGRFADARDRTCHVRRAVAVDHQPRIALRDQMRVEMLRQRLGDAGNADDPRRCGASVRSGGSPRSPSTRGISAAVMVTCQQERRASPAHYLREPAEPLRFRGVVMCRRRRPKPFP